MSLSVCLLTNDNNSSIQFYPSSPLLLLFALVYSIFIEWLGSIYPPSIKYSPYPMQ